MAAPAPRMLQLGTLIVVFLGGVGVGYTLQNARSAKTGSSTVAAKSDSAGGTPADRSSGSRPTPQGAGLTAAAAGPASSDALISRVAEVMTMGADFRREREFYKLLDEMKPSDAIAVRKLLARTMDQGVLYESLWAAFWTRWGELDGAAAMEYILSTQTHGAVPKDIRRVMRGWGASNPEQAAAWAEANQGKYLRDELVGLTDGYASVDLAGATAMALQAAPEGDANLGALMEVLAEQANRQGRTAGVTAWFDQLPQGTTEGARGKALDHVYWRLLSADVEKAKDWVRLQSTQPWRSDRVVGELAGKIAEKDPAAAAAWLESVPASPQDGKHPGLDSVLRSWIAKDRDAAQKWVDGLVDGALKSQAQGALARGSAPRVNVTN